MGKLKLVFPFNYFYSPVNFWGTFQERSLQLIENLFLGFDYELQFEMQIQNLTMEETKKINKLCKFLHIRGMEGDCYNFKTPFDIPVSIGQRMETDIVKMVKSVPNFHYLPCENNIIEESESNGFRNFICALIYLDMFMTNNPGCVISSKNVTMLVYIAFLVADKYNDDMSYENIDYTEKLKLDIKQFNECEMLFLNAINFKLRITNEQYIAFYNTLKDFIN